MKDHYNLLLSKHAKKNRDEEKATGIDVEIKEVDQLLDDIQEEIEIAKETLFKKSETEKTKDHADKIKGEEMRAVAMESMGETRNRKLSDDSPGGSTRRNLSDTLVYLRESAREKVEANKMEWELRREELEFRKQEHEERSGQTQTLMQQIQQQQIVHNNFIQQQIQQQKQQFQMQTELFKSLINKLNNLHV